MTNMGNSERPGNGRGEGVRSWQLLTTMGTAGALAGFLLVFVFQSTQPAIQAHKAEVLRQAIQDVLKAPDRYDTLYVTATGLAAEPPGGADPQQFEQVYLGYRGGEPVGFALTAGRPGFQDIIKIIFGYDPATRTLLGMKVLESKETPGLGDKIEKDAAFVAQFDGALPPIVGVKRGQAGDDLSKIDMITGATISSRTVIRIIDDTLERLGPFLEYEAGQ